MVEDWEEGRCEVVDGVLVAAPDFFGPDPDIDYSQWNEEAEIVRRMENPEIDGRDYPADPFDINPNRGPLSGGHNTRR